MKNKLYITILCTKSYVLCVIIVLVGCVSATAPLPTHIDTPTFPQASIDIWTRAHPPSLSANIPIDTTQSNESNNRFFADRQIIVTGPRENVDAVLHEVCQDGVLIEKCDPGSLSTFSFDSLNVKIEDGIFAVNELRNTQDVFTNSNYLTSPLKNSGPSSLPTSGGGGSGGRKTPKQGML